MSKATQGIDGDNAGSTDPQQDAGVALTAMRSVAPPQQQPAKAVSPPERNRDAEATYFRATFSRRRSFNVSSGDSGEGFGPAYRFGVDE